MNVMHERQHSSLFGAVAPVLLRLIQGLVGCPNEVGRGRDAVGHSTREAEADRDGIPAGVFDFRFADFSSECIRDLCRTLHRRSRQHDDEFVASISRD